VWFRGIFVLNPRSELMAAFLLFALWPFTRLVHVFSAPLGYLTRPYIVYAAVTTSSAPGSPDAAGSE
jgi:nitrate reductase gamma subunit